MAAPTWARARAGPHPACVRANVHVGAALSIESAPFYRMARFLGIPRKRSAFCRKRRFLKSAEHIYICLYIIIYIIIIMFIYIFQCRRSSKCFYVYLNIRPVRYSAMQL